MCLSKFQGGLSFKKFSYFNLVLLVKQDCRIIQDKRPPFYRIYKAKYFFNNYFFESQLWHNPFYAWRRIWKVKYWLHKGCISQIGNSKYVSIWQDRWVPGKSLLPTPKHLGINVQQARVDNLIDEGTNCWNAHLIHSIFDLLTVAAILILLNLVCYRNKQIWKE